MKKAILSLFVLVMSACSGYNSTNDARIEDENGRKLLTTHRDNKEVEEELISYEEFTDQNPNFPNTTPARTTDYEKMREVIEAETPYRLGDLKVNGRDAWVTIHTGKDMSESEKKRAQEIAAKELFEGLPRFHFHVKAVR
ncbi:hypothetical protein ACFOU2_24100 [Bacillus songklensis]|uniref:Sporulation protein n=1 Tax=Bacillus songklensis TaxID=1069116 RepID=A0ABV8BAA5_9BACI